MKEVLFFLFKALLSNFVYVIFSAVLTFFLYNIVRMSDLFLINSSLQNISIGFFTLTGIWIAYIYPKAILSFASSKKLDGYDDDELNRIQSLVEVVVFSIVILISALMFNLFYALLNPLVLNLEARVYLKILAVFSIFLLFFLQLKMAFQLIISNIDFINDLFITRAKKKASDELFPEQTDNKP
ncbi:hypothetical protein [Marinomonas sp. ef1]|uniref:hypothetical protein n=1 Tax=Marinomonas sp. ef1 TaxID=2005043 RepID=UPI000C287430|nr:hypothetical protein [Marinomonas sp. ef1]